MVKEMSREPLRITWLSLCTSNTYCRSQCDVAAGDRKAAHAAYARVYERFGDLPAGQNALFASARLAARAGDSVRARRLFERYLQRYPEGRFAHEAAARLSP